MTQRWDVILHAVWKRGGGLLREAFPSEGESVVGWKSGEEKINFSPFVFSKKHTPPCSGKLPAVTTSSFFNLHGKWCHVGESLQDRFPQKNQLYVVYFDQLLGAACTLKLVKTLFFSCFPKKVENGWKKCFDQLFGARSTQKLVKIHNSCILLKP